MGSWEGSQWGSEQGQNPGTHQCHGVPGVGLAHLANGAGPGLQSLGPIGSQLLHFFPGEEELKGEAKPVEDKPAHQGSPLPRTCTQSQTRPLHQAGSSARPCSLCAHRVSGAGTQLEVPFSGAGAGERLGSAHAQGDEVPALNVAQGLSALLCLEEEQGSLQGAPSALEVCGTRELVALGWALCWLPSRALRAYLLCSSWCLGAWGGLWPDTGTRCVSPVV